MIYLLISALLLLGLFVCLRGIRLDVIAIAFFIGLGRVISLRAMQETWETIPINPELHFFRWTVCVINDYYFFFLLLSLAPIGLYAALTLIPEHTPGSGLSARYLTGLLFIGVGGYLTWMQAEKFSIFYIWDIDTWTFGIQWGALILFLGIGLSGIGFWATCIRRGEE